MTKIVNEDSFTIGRSMDCAISLTEDSISRVHLSVYRRQEQIWVEDKGSSNGTFINNVKITQNTLVNIVPSDKIRLGKSDYVISMQLEVKEDEASDEEESDSTEFMQSPLVAEKIVERKIEKSSIDIQIERAILPPKDSLEKKASDLFSPKVDPKLIQNQQRKPASRSELPYVPEPDNSAEFEGERIIHEAHKKAAQIIYEGEMQAEKRVQAIYVQARERQAEADAYYQKKISTAHREADSVIFTFQSQGQELITQARHMAQELRDEVDLYVENMREKTRKEVDQIISDARIEADTVKKEAFEKAISKAEIEAADIISSAKSEAQDLLGFAKMQSDEMLEKARTAIETDLKDLRMQIDDKQKQVNMLRKESEEMEIKFLGEKEEHESRIAELVDHLNALQEELHTVQKDLANTRVQESNSFDELKRQEQAQEELKVKNQELLQERSNLESKLKELQNQLGYFSLDIQSATEKRNQMEQELNQQKAQLKERLEKERAQAIKESEDRLNEAQLEMGKRLQKLEKELFDEILNRKEKLVKELIVVVETRIAKVLEPAKWDVVSGTIYEGVQEVIEGKSVSFTDPGNGTPKQSMSLQRKKKKEHMRWLLSGVACGLFVAFGVVRLHSMMTEDKNPMRTIANEDARRRKEDLEKRKFNPAQVRELKETYTDAVIYTQDFVGSYQNAEFQKKLYKAASAYLLKTWRVDEDKSIQVLSMASALVKELQDKRQNIHPDFVKDGIQKMRALEKQSLDRMKTVLGSEVRLESYRRFERRIYEQEFLK